MSAFHLTVTQALVAGASGGGAVVAAAAERTYTRLRGQISALTAHNRALAKQNDNLKEERDDLTAERDAYRWEAESQQACRLSLDEPDTGGTRDWIDRGLDRILEDGS